MLNGAPGFIVYFFALCVFLPLLIYKYPFFTLFHLKTPPSFGASLSIAKKGVTIHEN